MRIGPNELHITDVNAYKVIYSQANPFPKYAAFYDGFNTPHTVFAECDPVLHKERRRLLNPLFSRTGVFKLEPVIQEKMRMVAQKINTLWERGPINTYDAFRLDFSYAHYMGDFIKLIRTSFRLLTTEVVLQFAFGRSGCMIEEDKTGFHSWFLDGFDVASQSLPDLQYNPWLRWLSNLLPESIVYRMSPEISNLLNIAKVCPLGTCKEVCELNSNIGYSSQKTLCVIGRERNLNLITPWSSRNCLPLRMMKRSRRQ